RRVEAAEAAARAHDSPASAGAFENLESNRPADAPGQVEDQRKRSIRICQGRVAAEPDKLLASNQLAAVLARAPLGQNEVEPSGVECLHQTAAEPDRHFKVAGA